MKAVHRLSLALLIVALMLATAGAASAAAESPWWQLGTEVVPTNLPPEGEGRIIVAATNLGDAAIHGSPSPVVITDSLPAGLTVLGEEAPTLHGVATECSGSGTVTCKFAGLLNPYEQIAIPIRVKVEEPLGTTTVFHEASVEGGGGARVSRRLAASVNATPAPFGVAGYELSALSDGGAPATQAGTPPFELTTTLVMNDTAQRQPVALPKDVSVNLPPGLVGNPTAASECSETDFAALVEETNLCPPNSVVGVATVVANEPLVAHIFTKTVPVFNLVPSAGEPARLGFEVLGRVPIVIDASVRSGRDYGVVATVRNASEVAGLLSSEITLWGVPGDPRHNNSRGWECVAGGAFERQVNKPCPASPELSQTPFLRSATSCAASPSDEPVTSSLEADSWAQPGTFVSSDYAWSTPEGLPLGLAGCSGLAFTPALGVAPEAESVSTHSASTPTGLTVQVKVPQQDLHEPGGLAEADLRDSTVTLPEGVELSPSAANGLESCSEEQIGFVGLNAATATDEFSTAKPSCPDSSKVGVVHIKTPLLSHELEGYVYLASPAPNGEATSNPFGSLVALYVVAEDPASGVLVKLAGEGQLNEETLRVSTTFRNTPQVPFEDLRIELFGGPRASLSTPPSCGTYGTAAVFTPWSGTGPVAVSSPLEEFAITSGAEGGGCPGGGLPFSPGFDAQMASAAAGGFSPFALEITRPDGDQAVQAVTMHLPAGVSGMLSSVKLCPEPQASRGECAPESQVGHAIESAGLGPEPYVESGGKVYITGPYGGAPFGLSIVTPAVAGPFNLGTVVVRSRIYVDRTTAALTIVSDPLPTQLKGIPLQLKRIRVNVDRPNFQFNPSNCSPMKVDASISGSQGAVAGVSSPFQASGCASLPFHPTFTASTQGHTSKANGASLTVKVTSAFGQANIGKASVTLPEVLPSRLTTIQKACIAATFEANPASCPEGSLVGTATVHTPVLTNALTGPAYLVSHGSAAFPDLEFVLQGEGITLVLDGQTLIHKGVTSSTFNTLPDAPVSSFETVLPEGPHSALAANANLCTQTLTMPTTLTAQNGAVITQSTKITVQGCGAVKGSKIKKLTRAQKLKNALKACRKRYRHAAGKRASCEKQARKSYGAKKAGHAGKRVKGKARR